MKPSKSMRRTFFNALNKTLIASCAITACVSLVWIWSRMCDRFHLNFERQGLLYFARLQDAVEFTVLVIVGVFLMFFWIMKGE